VSETNRTPAARLKLASGLLRAAGAEYANAIVDGKMQNAHDYQGALGFTTIARSVITELDDNIEAKEKAIKLLDALKPLWPDLMPPENFTAKAEQLYGAAARMELLALGI